MDPNKNFKKGIKSSLSCVILCFQNISDKSNNLKFILESFHLSVNMLQECLPPFLRDIKKEVIGNPCGFDMCSLTAIPSPRLRRELQIFNK